MRKYLALFLSWLTIIPSGPALILAAFTGSARAQSNFDLRATYPTQSAFCYYAVDDNTTPYNITVTTDMAGMNVINDFNSTMFPGSNVDLTRSDTIIEGGANHVRCVQIGHGPAPEYDANGVAQSRATPAATPLYYNVNGVTGSITTSNNPLGQSYGVTRRPDPNMPGSTFFPYWSWTDRTQVAYDTQNGTTIRQGTLPGDKPDNLPFTTTGCSGSLATWLDCQFNLTSWVPSNGNTLQPNSAGAILRSAWCSANCGAAGAKDVEVEFSFDRITWSSPVTATLGTSSTDQTVYQDGTSTATVGQFWPGLPLTARYYYAWQPERLSNSGSSTTVELSGTAVCPTIVDNTYIQIANSNLGTYRITAHNCGAMPNTLTLSNAINLTTAASFGTLSGWDSNPALSFRVRQKNPGTGSTLNVSSVDIQMNRGDIPGAPSSSGGFINHFQPPTYSVANWHLGIQNQNVVYSWNDQTNDFNTLGTVYTSCGGALDFLVNIGKAFGSNTWDNTTGGVLWGNGPQGGKTVVVKLTVTQDPTVFVQIPNRSDPEVTNTCSVLTPTTGGHDLNSLIEAFDPAWTSAYQSAFACSVDSVTELGHLVIVCRRSGQDSRDAIWIFDPGNGLPIGSGGTGAIIAGNFQSNFANTLTYRFGQWWAGMHTVFDCNNCGSWISWQSSAAKNLAGAGDQPAFTELVQYCADVVQPVTANLCVSKLPGLPSQSDGTETWIWVTSTWDAMWGTQPAGFNEGDPVTQCPGATCLALDRWERTFHAGDIITRNYFTPEFLQVTDVNAVDADGRPIKVKRGIYNDLDSSYSCNANPTACTWTASTPMYAQGIGFPGSSGFAWNYITSPDGTDPAAFHWIALPGGGHQSVRNEFLTASPPYTGYVAESMDTAPAFIKTPDSRAFIVPDATTFAGVTSPAPGECLEGHPSDAYQFGSGSTSRAFGVDVNPIIGDPSCFNTATGATLVSWPIYKFAAANVHLHQKQFETLMTAGPYLLKPISGPGSLLTTSQSDWWKGCYALTAGECYAGSSAGEFYFSAPNVYFDHCELGSTNLQHICVGDMPYQAASVVQYNFPSPDNYTDPTEAPKVTGMRSLSVFGLEFFAQPNTDNCKAMPNNGLTNMCSGSNAPNIPRWLGNVPIPPAPPTYDGIDRTTYVAKTLSITSVPMGTAKVRVAMGNSPDLYPSYNRAEIGYVVTATVDTSDPWLWDTEWSGEGITCPVSCDVEMPTVWGLVNYYRVDYLDSMGSVISSGPVLMEAASFTPPPSARPSFQLRGRARLPGRSRFIQ